MSGTDLLSLPGRYCVSLSYSFSFSSAFISEQCGKARRVV